MSDASHETSGRYSHDTSRTSSRYSSAGSINNSSLIEPVRWNFLGDDISSTTALNVARARPTVKEVASTIRSPRLPKLSSRPSGSSGREQVHGNRKRRPAVMPRRLTTATFFLDKNGGQPGATDKSTFLPKRRRSPVLADQARAITT